MPRTDTLFVADSNSCKFIKYEFFPPRSGDVRPVSGIWNSSTVVTSSPALVKKESDIENNVVSGVVFVYFIIVIFFLRQIISVTAPLFSTFLRHSNNSKLEEKTGLSYKRNIFFFLSALFLTISIVATVGGELKEIYEIFIPYFFLIIFGILISVWLLRKLIFRLTSWLTQDKHTFSEIERISYNYFILGTSFSFIMIIYKLTTGYMTLEYMLNTLSIVFLATYIMYIFRTFEVIRSHRFSIVFYILYLCTVEILPLSILTNLILAL